MPLLLAPTAVRFQCLAGVIFSAFLASAAWTALFLAVTTAVGTFAFCFALAFALALVLPF